MSYSFHLWRKGRMQIIVRILLVSSLNRTHFLFRSEETKQKCLWRRGFIWHLDGMTEKSLFVFKQDTLGVLHEIQAKESYPGQNETKIKCHCGF